MPLFGFTNIAGSVITQTSIAVASGGASDADAQAFITAASITDATQISAIDQLVIDLKGYNIWDKMKAIYPIVGGSAGSHAVNLKTPGTYDLTFSTGWTHASTGMTPNGTNAYANTFCIPSTHLSLNSTHLSYYGTTSGVPASTGISMGSVVNIGDFALTYIATSSDSNFYPMINCGTTGGTGLSYIPSRYNSLMIGNRVNSTQQQGWANNVKTTLTRSSYGLNSASIYIGARNNNGTADNYCTNQCRFSSIGEGLTDTEASNLYSAVQTFNTTLSRNI